MNTSQPFPKPSCVARIDVASSLLERAYQKLARHLEILQGLEHMLKQGGQWVHGTPPPSWSDPDVRSLFEAEHERPNEGFLRWLDTYAEILETLPKTMRSRLDPRTNWTMRAALQCRLKTHDGKYADFLCDGDTDLRELERRGRSDTDQAMRLVQERILPEAIPELVRSRVPGEIRGRSREVVFELIQEDPQRFLPQALHESNLSAKIQTLFTPIADRDVRKFLQMLKDKGVLEIWELPYLSGLTSRYYFPAPVTEGVPAAVATVPTEEHNAKPSTRTSDAAPGEDAHQSMERATAPDATGWVARDSASQSDAQALAQQWNPPAGYVGTNEIANSSRFRKATKNPVQSTIQRWVERDRKEAKENRRDPVKIVRAPDTHENYYPESWVLKQIRRWNPRPPTDA